MTLIRSLNIFLNMSINISKIELKKFIFSAYLFVYLFFIGETLYANENIIVQDKENTVYEKVDSKVSINELDEPTEKQLTEEINRYRRLIQSETFDEADNAAKSAIELAIQIFGTE